jgi:hypothetical protein
VARMNSFLPPGAFCTEAPHRAGHGGRWQALEVRPHIARGEVGTPPADAPGEGGRFGENHLTDRLLCADVETVN